MLMLGLLIFSTCRKSFLPSGEQPLLQASFGVIEARNHIKALVRGEVAYDGKPSIIKQMQTQDNQTLSLAEIPTIKRGQKIFYPFWDKAITANYKGKADYVEVPIALSHKQIKLYQFAKDQLAAKPDESVARASFQRLVVFKDRRGRINQRLLTYIPDKDYVRQNANKLSTNSLKKLDPQFKGYLEYRNWTGDVVSVLRVEKGKVVRIYKISKKDKKLNTNNKYTKKAISKSSIITLDDEPSCIWVSTPIYDTVCEVIENGDPEADVLNEVECTYGVVGYEEDYVCTWEQNPDPDPCPWGNCDENPEEPCWDCEEAPDEPEIPTEIINHVTDSCLKNVVNVALNNNVINEIKDIIEHLDVAVNVKVNIFDAAQTINGSAGITTGSKWETINGIINFSTNITLSKDLLLNSSKEHVTAVLLHEILHAYFRQSTEKKEELEGADHQRIAEKYVNPMANYLSSLFGISLLDATALAWDGLADTDAYKNTTEFSVGSGENAYTISKQDLQIINTNYVLKLNDKGGSLCE